MKIYEIGDVVETAFPLAHILNKDLKGERCDYCFNQRPSLSRCSNCKWTFYCDKKCQLTDWKAAHKYECKIYRSDAELDTRLVLHESFSRLLLRLLIIKTYYPEKMNKLQSTYDGGQRCFNDLMDHTTEIQTSEKSNRWNYFLKIVKRFNQLDIDFTEDQLFSLFGKIVINSFSILNLSLNEIGTGLYVSSSVYDHSCSPNCSPVFDGIKLQIRCIRRFDSSLEPATITYIDLKLPKEERQMKLRDQYYFNCDCNRCSSDEDDGIGRQLMEMNENFDHEIESGNWVKAFLLGLETLPLYEKIYKTYYADFTVQLMRLAKIRANIDNGPDDRDELSFLLRRLQEAILITHGKDHPLFTEEFAQLTGLK